MTTEVIILAQGVQSRLPELAIPKQWLPLPACGNTPILERTLVQLSVLCDGIQPARSGAPRVTTIAAPELRACLLSTIINIPRPTWATTSGEVKWCHIPRVYELADPGNSSLKGAKAALAELRLDFAERPTPPADRTVILLGDVVYSWRCLEELLHNSLHDVTVCGTSDLSPSGGELWGLSWHREWDELVRRDLDVALEKHPPFREYQPGQLRRWYWQMVARNDCATRIGMSLPLVWQTVDDYTDDVDVPADVTNLPKVAEAAAADDLTRGITWPL